MSSTTPPVTSHPCPRCGVAMRAYGAREVCDVCGGMLITAPDLENAVIELGADSLRLVPADLAAPMACPSCQRAMTGVTLEPSGRAVRGAVFACCATHGLWFPGGALARVFSIVSHRAHAGAGFDRSYGGVTGGGGGGGGAVWSGGGAFGLSSGMGVNQANADSATFEGADGGLWISDWRARRNAKPMVITPFASALAGKTLLCPHCRDPLHLHHDHWACDLCSSVFVESDALVAMVEAMTGAPWTLPRSTGAPTKHLCPACQQAMAFDELDGVALARCAAHGVWLPAELLADVLEREAEGANRSWLSRLFHKH